VAALAGGVLVVHFTNRKHAPLLFSTRPGTRPPGPLCVAFRLKSYRSCWAMPPWRWRCVTPTSRPSVFGRP